MQKKLYPSDLYYNQGESAKRVTDYINSLCLWVNDACQLVISPATANISVSDANAGAVIPVSLYIMSSEATPCKIDFAEFTLAASIADTVSDATLVPSIDDATPNTLAGEVVVNVTIPEATGEKTYVAEETITLTIADYTAKDGRKITGGTCVITVIADE